jgi:hypothetical protein
MGTAGRNSEGPIIKEGIDLIRVVGVISGIMANYLLMRSQEGFTKGEMVLLS